MGSMNIQQERRTNPYPWTWEIPTAVALMVVLVMTLALHAARAIANVLAGAGWRFPAREELFTSLPGLLGGDAGAGLVGPSGRYVSSGALWVWIVLTEVVVLVIVALVVRWGLAQWGPGRVQGMATAAESEQLLGISRLRRNAAIIRPDLHSKKGTR